MKFVADENIDRSIVERLRSQGHELFYVAEMDPGISDDERDGDPLLQTRPALSEHL